MTLSGPIRVWSWRKSYAGMLARLRGFEDYVLWYPLTKRYQTATATRAARSFGHHEYASLERLAVWSPSRYSVLRFRLHRRVCSRCFGTPRQISRPYRSHQGGLMLFTRQKSLLGRIATVLVLYVISFVIGSTLGEWYKR